LWNIGDLMPGLQFTSAPIKTSEFRGLALKNVSSSA